MNHLPFEALLLLLLISSAAFQSTASPSPAPSSLQRALGCNEKCTRRCSRAGWRDRCLKYCGICCGKCNGCVPSGPIADRAQCPCYRDLIVETPNWKDKCP